MGKQKQPRSKSGKFARQPLTDGPERATAAQRAEQYASDDTPLSFTSPESSSIGGASYDPDTQVLAVDFKRNPAIPSERYVFGGFPPEKWKEFMEADSKGTYFAKWIRPLFSGKPSGVGV